MLKVSSHPRRDFGLLRAVLLVFHDDEVAAVARRSFEAACPEARLIHARTVAEAERALQAQPITVAVGALRLDDGVLTDLVGIHADVPLVVLVDEGDEVSGVQAVAAGALDWATRTEALLASLPDIALGAAREWREFGLRRAAEEQLRHADRLALVGRIAAGAVHEISTPLNVLRMRAQLLALDPSALDEATQTIVEQADRIQALLRRMLALSRRTGQGRQPVDLQQVVQSALDLLGPAFRTAQVRVQLEGAPAVVDADPSEILQVVLNLLSNAADAMPAGGTITVHTAVEGGLARLAVRDTGDGIAPEHLPHIFAPFFTTKDPGCGTGLGLSVSAQIAADHGGRITAESRSGEGATFRLELPAAAA